MDANQLVGSKFAQLGVSDHLLQFFVEEDDRLPPVHPACRPWKTELEERLKINLQQLLPCAIVIGTHARSIAAQP